MLNAENRGSSADNGRDDWIADRLRIRPMVWERNPLMQNLFVKFLVLGSVIGSSCFVVWQAHDGLKTVAHQGINPQEFVQFEDSSSGTSESVAKPTSSEQTEVVDWENPLKLAISDLEPVPTPAKSPLAQDAERPKSIAELGAFDPLAATPEPTPTPAVSRKDKELDDSEFPQFGKAPAQTENEPVPTLAATDAGAASMPSDPFGGSAFVELPDQQVEKPEADDAPLAARMEMAGQPAAEEKADEKSVPELLPIPSSLPNDKGIKEDLPKSDVAEMKQRFGPLSSPVDEAAELKTLPEPTLAEKASPGEMPGLTKLPPSHPGPVLLPAEPTKLPEQAEQAAMAAPMQLEAEDPFDTERSSPNMVVTADGKESVDNSIQRVSDSALSAPPRELPPAQAAPMMPAEFPAVPARPLPREMTREMPSEDPFGAEPAPQRDQRPSVMAPEVLPLLPSPEKSSIEKSSEVVPAREPEPTLKSLPVDHSTDGGADSLPEIILAGGTPQRSLMNSGSGMTSDSREILPVAGEAPASTPPLPPTGEVLPDLIPSASGSPDSPPAAMPAATSPSAVDEVLPFADNELIPPPATPAAPAPTVPPSSLPSMPPAPSEFEAGPSPAVLPEAPQANPVSPPSGSSSSVPMTPSSPLIGTTEFNETAAPQGAQTPELKIEKIAPPVAEVGEPVIYAIVIRNVGGSEARDVVVEDRIPRGARLEGTIPQAYLNDGKLSWQLGTIEPGGERKIQLKVTPIEAGKIGSVATVSFASAVAASIKVNAPQLSVEMKGPSEVTLGEPMNLQFILKNNGQGVAKSVFLRTILPQGLTHPGGNDLEYDSGTLNPGSEKIVDLVVHAEKPGTYTIQTQASNDGKTHDESKIDVNVIKSRLEISRTGPDNRFIGRPTNVLLRVTNTSGEVLRDITVQEKLPAGVELAAIPGGGRWDPQSRTITWKLEELGPGDARELTVLYTASQVGRLTGRIVAVDRAGNQAALDTVLNVKGFSELTPDFRIGQRTVLVNERVTLQMTLKNTGSDESRNVRAQFVLPEEFEFISARGPVSHEVSGRKVAFSPIAVLAPGAEETFHLAILAKQPTQNATKVTLMVEADDYSDPVFLDQAIRVIPLNP